jgi:hypothetical protein
VTPDISDFDISNLPPPLGHPTPPDRSAVSWLASVSLHLLFFLWLGWFTGHEPSGTDEDLDRPIGIARVHRRPDRDLLPEFPAESQKTSATQKTPTQNSAGQNEAGGQGDGDGSAALSAMPAGSIPPIDFAAAWEGIASTPTPVGGEGPIGSGATSGQSGVGVAVEAGGPEGQSEIGTTSVFGITGSGSAFAYVFDRSDSMNEDGGRPLREAKRELIQSLTSLTDRQRFSLIFYNDRPTPFAPTGAPYAMLPCDEAMLTTAKRYVESIRAYGGTEHVQAIELALRLSPDVIFFLTDASMPPVSSSDLQSIQASAQTTGTTIHTIEFGTTPAAAANSFMKELAAMNGGRYRYINVRNINAQRLR